MGEADDRAVRDVVAVVERLRLLPAVLVRAPAGRIVGSSASARTLFGLTTEELRERSVSALAPGFWRSPSMRLLLADQLTSFSARVGVKRAGTQIVPATVWARRIVVDRHQWVLLGIYPDGDEGAQGLRMLVDADDRLVVMAVGDGLGNFADVGSNVTDLLGYSRDEFVALAVTGFIHAEDLPSLMNVAAHVSATRGTASVPLRLRHRDGSWRSTRVFLTSFGGMEPARLGITIVPAAAADATGRDDGDRERMADLEGRLRRIALEIAAVGMLDGAGADLDPAVAIALAGLTPRRQEIVERLRAGDRVPTIAAAMFLSQSTVRNHLSAIFRSVGVSSQEELVQALRGRRERVAPRRAAPGARRPWPTR